MAHRTETKGVLASESDRLSALESLAGRLKAHLDASRAKVVDDCLSIYRNNEFVIMICGEISVGKSSFLNTLVGTDFLLTDQTETTAAITYIRSVDNPLAEPGHADEVKVTFRDASRAPEWVPMGDRARMRELTTSLSGNEVAIRTVEKAEVFLRRETLELPPEITIIDTPGLNGSESHSELTHSEMGKCHVALFLLDGSKFGTLTNREEFRRLCRYAPEVLFVVSKWDLSRGGYLGEHPTREGLERVKREDFLPRLSGWMEGGELSTGDIYVVSCHEVEEARQSYGALDEDARRTTRLESLLPSEDNDFFRLQGRLGEIMHSSERRRVMYRRPLHTLLRLAEDRLQEVEGRLDEINVVQLEREYEQACARLTDERATLEQAFEEVRLFAEDLARREKKVLCELVQSGGKKVRDEFLSGLSLYPWRELVEERTRGQLRERLRALLTQCIEQPLLERQGAFDVFLRGILESELSLGVFKQGGQGEIGDKHVQAGMEELRQRQSEMETRLRALSDERQAHEDRIAECQRERQVQEGHLEMVRRRLGGESALREEMARIRRQMDRLGPCPSVRTWQEEQEHMVAVPREFKLWNPFTWFGGEDYEVEYTTVTRTDTRERDEWQRRQQPLLQKLEGLRQRLKAFEPLHSQETRLEGELQRLDGEMKRERSKIVELQERAAREQGLRGKFEPEKMVATCRELWSEELRHILGGFEEIAERFEAGVRHLLDDYWLRRELTVTAYLDSLRSEFERRREASRSSAGDYEALRRTQEDLVELVKEFRQSLAEL